MNLEGGDFVDADGNPLSYELSWQKVEFLFLEIGARPYVTCADTNT